MKSHELAKLLLDNPDLELLLQKDAEGNGYSTVRGIDFGIVATTEDDYEFEVYSDEEDPEELYMEQDEFDTLKNKYAVIYP